MKSRVLRAFAVALVTAVLLVGCAPAASALAGLIEHNDGATLAYIERGVSFDPGPAVALRVIVRAEGDDLALLEVPADAICTVVTDRLACELGEVASLTSIGVTGKNVIASASWKRVGAWGQLFNTTLHD